MSAIPYMPLYVADYIADAAHLTTEEHGAYLLLIMTYWQRGKPLPADPNRLANIARMSNERWTDVQRTLSEFFIIGDGVWSHKRIEAELLRFRDKSEKAKAAGKASGARRTTKTPTDVQRKPNGRSTDVQRTLNHTDPDPEREEEEETKILPLEQVAAREAEVKALAKSSLGRGGVVSPAARLKVAARLCIATADPLVGLYEAWGPSRRAEDPDGHFISSAAKFWAAAGAEVRAACMPLVAEPPIPIQRPTARASSALANSKLVGGRHGLSRH